MKLKHYFGIVVFQLVEFIMLTSLKIFLMNHIIYYVLLVPYVRNRYPNLHRYATLATSTIHIYLCLTHYEFSAKIHPEIPTRWTQLTTDVLVVVCILIYLMFFTRRPLIQILEELVLRYPIRHRPQEDIFGPESSNILLVELLAIFMYSAIIFGLKHSYLLVRKILEPTPPWYMFWSHSYY